MAQSAGSRSASPDPEQAQVSHHDETQFASDVMAWLEAHPLAAQRLAIECKVAISTVDRWSRGIAVPAVNVRRAVRQKMRRIAP